MQQIEKAMSALVFATSLTDTQTNIRRYQKELSRSKNLRSRVSYVRAWYVDRGTNGDWLFAPSKFVGYRFSSAEDYIAEAGHGGHRDGRDTERLLASWYQEIDPETRLGRELFAALRAFLGTLNQAPNKLARINISKSDYALDLPRSGAESVDANALLSRIVTNPDICGGRPIVRGTRVRVTDIVEMMAHGATREDVLQDFDYLDNDDIAAALLYAARASDHRTIRAA